MNSRKEIMNQMQATGELLKSTIESETGESFEVLVSPSGVSLFTQTEEAVAFAIQTMSQTALIDVRYDFDEELGEFGIFGNFPS